MKLGVPDCIFRDIYKITPDFLKELGIRLIICDIDNTLVPYEIPDPTPEILDWMRALEAAMIKLVFVSNNHAPRADRFNKPLGYTVYADAKKPLTMALTKALRENDVQPQEAAALGDQIFTDVLAGQFRGTHTLLVPPIKDKNNWFFRTKRILERPFIASYFKKKPDDELYAYWNLKTRLKKEKKA